MAGRCDPEVSSLSISVIDSHVASAYYHGAILILGRSAYGSHAALLLDQWVPQTSSWHDIDAA